MSDDRYWYCRTCKEEFSKQDGRYTKRHALTGEPECPNCGTVLNRKNRGETL